MKLAVATWFVGGLALLFPSALRAQPRNFYEWSAVAPVVISATSLGQDGRYVEVRVLRVFRGAVAPDAALWIDLRQTNRERNRNVTPHALRIDAGVNYLLLLEPGSRYRDGVQSYSIVRGVRGVRELPAEGADQILDALDRFVEVQDLKTDGKIWDAMSEMLEATNPLLVETALEQFDKFGRGDPELLLTLRPLLDHPSSSIREWSSRLIGGIVARHPEDELPEEVPLRAELIGAARRDPVVNVRVAATEALGRFPDAATVEVLEEIAASDADQSVRYVAEKILLDRRARADGGRRD